MEPRETQNNILNFFLEPFMASWPQNFVVSWKTPEASSHHNFLWPWAAEAAGIHSLKVLLLLSSQLLIKLKLSLHVWDSKSDWLKDMLHRSFDQLEAPIQSNFWKIASNLAASFFIWPPSKLLYEPSGFNFNQIGRAWCQSIGKWGQESQFSRTF